MVKIRSGLWQRLAFKGKGKIIHPKKHSKAEYAVIVLKN